MFPTKSACKLNYHAAANVFICGVFLLLYSILYGFCDNYMINARKDGKIRAFMFKKIASHAFHKAIYSQLGVPPDACVE